MQIAMRTTPTQSIASQTGLLQREAPQTKSRPRTTTASSSTALRIACTGPRDSASEEIWLMVVIWGREGHARAVLRGQAASGAAAQSMHSSDVVGDVRSEE